MRAEDGFGHTAQGLLRVFVAPPQAAPLAAFSSETCENMYICVHKYSHKECMCVYIDVYMYIYIYIYIHMYTLITYSVLFSMLVGFSLASCPCPSPEKGAPRL